MTSEAPPRRTTNPVRRSAPRDANAGEGRRVSRLIWAAVYVLVTTFSFAPTLTLPSAPVRAGAIATRDYVAPRDLIIPDPASTTRRRAEAAAEVLPVYDWDSGAAPRLEKELGNSFRKAREGLPAARRRTAGLSAVRDAFGLPLGEEPFAALVRLSFSQEIEDRLALSAAELYRGGVVDNRDLLLENRTRGVVLRDATSGQETRLRELADAVEYGSPVKNALMSRLSGGPLRGREVAEVSAWLAGAMRPNLSFNGTETEHRRDQASRSVETVLTKIPRGKILVRRGDEITPRAAEWIAAVRASVTDPSSWLKVVGVLVLQTLGAAAFWVDARRQRRRRRERNPDVVYASVLAAGIVFSLLTRGAFTLAEGLASSFGSSAWAAHTYYAIPFAAGAIMASLVSGMGPALLFAAVHAIGSSVLMGQSFSFVLFALVGSLAGIFSLGKLRSRSVLLAMGGIVAAANLVTITAIALLTGGFVAGDFIADGAAGLVGGWFVAMLIGAVLPLFEHFFHVTTDIRLLELSNQNLPLLRTLALEAPGTYQHSLMLGHLAEAAAEAIGADALLARVSGYYHDIGKTKMPDYFIENQPKGFNRHDRLEPSMSALIIAAHVKEGADMARKARLPDPIVAAIREHHGTKLIRYFYQKALTRSERVQGSVRDIEYRHSGPKPSSRVTGILMIADAVEAASRTLIEPSPAKIRAMIQTIVDDCLHDGQFDECDLTMRDLAIIAETLERTVSNVYHHRIDYPGFEFNRERPRRRTSESVDASAAAGKNAGPRPV
jgi:putative nucleotidyltransferase with HDIG domain